MANTFKFGNGNWAVKDGYALAYNDENNNFKPLPFDFTRASSATTLNRQGLIETVPSGKPRIDFLDNTDGHLLLEPSRTNVLLRSEELNTTWLTFRSSVTANDIVSPDGSQNAEKIIQQSGQTSSGGVYQNLTLSNSTVYTYSVFLKSGGYDFGMIRVDGGQYAWFDLFSGSVGTITGSGSSSIEDYGNGWFRCSFTITTTSTTGQPHIYIANSDGSQTLSGADGVKGIYAWGAVVEQGSYATSYIPTEGSSVTRVAETANDAGNSTVFNDSEGVLFAEIQALANDLTYRGISIGDGTSSNVVRIYYENVSNRFTANIKYAGVSQATMIYTFTDITVNSKIAVKYKQNDFALWVNGTEVATDSSGSAPTGLDVLQFDTGTGGDDFYGKVKDLKVYNTALTDTELQNLTS